ncbi:unnamed protein product [Fraxinus pennsylvanica]|uniref:Arp2/3 complex 34 kDa subunit n=1 Tax=Fraxinus pennsylvanica TaxID=56036 RepID=A0AAD2ADR0_9LAMI|nr:unnamed protein product [Fraxinus pennsylvanica]
MSIEVVKDFVVVGSTRACAKVPHCIWSPIPPPELRGEPIEDLSTNGGFVSLDITFHHVEGKKLDKTVWNLLNFYTFVKYHVKSTRGFIHRRLRMRLGNLVEILQNAGIEEEEQNKNKVQGFKYSRKFARFSKPKILRRRCNFSKKLLLYYHFISF